MTSKPQYPSEIPSKYELLRKYERKPVRRSLQYDGFVGAWGDQGGIDRNGDEVCGGVDYDLRGLGLERGSGLAVRIQISDGAKYDDVIRILHKLTDAVLLSLSERRLQRSDDDPDDVLADWDRDIEATTQELRDLRLLAPWEGPQ